jgi:hypothetical protein
MKVNETQSYLEGAYANRGKIADKTYQQLLDSLKPAYDRVRGMQAKVSAVRARTHGLCADFHRRQRPVQLAVAGVEGHGTITKRSWLTPVASNAIGQLGRHYIHFTTLNRALYIDCHICQLLIVSTLNFDLPVKIR